METKNRPRSILWLVALLALASGCTGEPRMRAAADLDLELLNTQAEARPVRVWLVEPYGDTELTAREYEVPPTSTLRDHLVRVPAGLYELGARSGDLERVVRVHLRPDTEYYRFVFDSDIIGFQQGGAP